MTKTIIQVLIILIILFLGCNSQNTKTNGVGLSVIFLNDDSKTGKQNLKADSPDNKFSFDVSYNWNILNNAKGKNFNIFIVKNEKSEKIEDLVTINISKVQQRNMPFKQYFDLEVKKITKDKSFKVLEQNQFISNSIKFYWVLAESDEKDYMLENLFIYFKDKNDTYLLHGTCFKCEDYKNRLLEIKRIAASITFNVFT